MADKQTSSGNSEPQAVQTESERPKAPTVERPKAPTVDWDDSDMRTSYSNVVNASSTREEVTLFFGTNLTWNPTEKREYKVRLSDRIVLNPFAAKRLWMLLGAILKEYESRFGNINIDVSGVDADVLKGTEGPGQ